MTEIELPGKKKVKHLTLLREPRRLTPRQFNALAFAERLAVVRAAQGRHKYDLILEAQDAEVLVHALAAQELFLLLKELGSEDAPELVALATTEQITTFLDLDLWHGDQLDEAKALQWLTLLMEAGEEKVQRTVLEMEFELLVLLVKKFVTVTASPGDMLDDESTMERRLEGVYDVAYRDSESAKILGLFLDLIFRRERDFYLQLMEAVRWEQESLLEEDTYQARGGRLLDHGFPDPVEAQGLYAWVDPASFEPAEHRKLPSVPGEAGVEAPSFVLAAARPRDLLAEVLAGGLDSETCWELTYLLNKMMIADQVDVGERSQVETAVAEVYRYLNLALEHLAEADPVRAAGLVETVYLEHLFRLGFSLTLRLQRRARRLAASSLGPWLDGPFRALVDGLGRRKPRLFEGVENAVRGGERPFANRRDLCLAEDWLDRLEIQRRLFEERFPFTLPAPAELELSGCVPGDPAEVGLSALFLTALANRVLGRAFIPRPLPAAELPALYGRVCEAGGVCAELRRETRHWLDSLEPGAAAFGDWCLDIWQEGLCATNAGQLDPRYVDGLIVRLE